MDEESGYYVQDGGSIMKKLEEHNRKSVWSIQYKGIGIEIQHFSIKDFPSGTKDCWTYYLYISPDRIPDKKLAEEIWLKPKYEKWCSGVLASYDYYNCWLSGLEWHGGITYYVKWSSGDEKMRIIKAGCDFQHFSDEGQHYDVEYVLMEATHTSDEFLSRVPDYKRHCGTIGGYWLPSEGIVSEDGEQFISQKGQEWAKEKYPDTAGWWEAKQ